MLPARRATSTWSVTDPGGLLHEFTDADEHDEFGDSLFEVLEVAHLEGAWARRRGIRDEGDERFAVDCLMPACSGTR